MARHGTEVRIADFLASDAMPNEGRTLRVGAGFESEPVGTLPARVGHDVVVCCPPYVKSGKRGAAAGVDSAALSRAQRPWHAPGTIWARLVARSRHAAGRSVVCAVPGGDGLAPDLEPCAPRLGADVNP